MGLQQSTPSQPVQNPPQRPHTGKFSCGCIYIPISGLWWTVGHAPAKDRASSLILHGWFDMTLIIFFSQLFWAVFSVSLTVISALKGHCSHDTHVIRLCCGCHEIYWQVWYVYRFLGSGVSRVTYKMSFWFLDCHWLSKSWYWYLSICLRILCIQACLCIPEAPQSIVTNFNRWLWCARAVPALTVVRALVTTENLGEGPGV